MRLSMEAAKPDVIALMTPHGVHVNGAMSIGFTPRAAGDLDALHVEAATDLPLASAWAEQAASRGIPVTPLIARTLGGVLPLDWGATIPLTLLDPKGELPTVIACPSRDLTRQQLVDWGEALVDATESLEKRVAFVGSADQGHGHAQDGPYGFTAASAIHDQAMREAIQADDLPRLLTWPEDYAETALADSYWQTLPIIGIQKRVPLHAQFLSYEVDHYFGLLCAQFVP